MKLPGENAMVVSQKFDYKKPVYPGTHLLIKAVLEKIDLRFSILDISVKISSIISFFLTENMLLRFEKINNY